QVLTSDISGITSLNVSNYGIYNLTGIEDFIALNELYCGRNKLTVLDVTQNTALQSLGCSDNLLTSLDVTQNTALQILSCERNDITGLDLSKNTALTNLYCFNNQLTSLNLKNGANTLLKFMSTYSNPLPCIEVDDQDYANAQYYEFWRKGISTRYSEDCSNTIYIPDANFETALIDLGYDSDGTINQSIAKSDAAGISSLDISSRGIKDIYGIKEFVNLNSLDCSNNELVRLNFKSGNNTSITYFDVRNNTALKCIEVDNETDANAGNGSYSGWLKDSTTGYSEDCPKTYVPDDKFEAALIYWGFDDVLDDYVLTSDMNNVEVIHFNMETFSAEPPVYPYALANLTGIEDCTNLKELILWYAYQPDNLDLSKNYNLKRFIGRGLTTESVILPENNSLETFSLVSTILNEPSLDFSKSPSLSTLNLKWLNLSVLNIKNGNNKNMFEPLLYSLGENLTCIQVDDAEWSKANWLGVLDPEIFSEDCGYTLSIEDAVLEQSIKIYPNPVTNVLQVVSPTIPLTKVEIYNSLGILVKQLTEDLNEIPVYNLSGGIYLMRLYGEKGVVIKKFIKR
ncbi:MAG: T9SS type A sorting domain-containing protein, partial [Flavobacteriaceae bacterium]|nr:T9SS type A sorting domain-containing protein [Flavobacteriaceae bacterium]